MASIGVVGMGWVGSSVAMATLQRGVGKELLLNDVRPGIAEGEAMDLEHGSMFYRADATVRSVDLDEIVEQTDAVVLCAGRGGASGESRLSLLRDNHALATELGTALRAYRGVVVVVTNPVDVLTQVLADASGLPPARVIGTGTMLDTARLRYELAERLRIHPRSVHADVVGEHGDSSVCLWSSASIGGRGLRAVPGWAGAGAENELSGTVRRAAYEIIRRKGATNHAIGLVTAQLLEVVIRDDRRVLTVSTVQTGTCGIDGVALSLPTVVGSGGAQAVIAPDMDDAEQEALRRSAQVLREALRDARGQ